MALAVSEILLKKHAWPAAVGGTDVPLIKMNFLLEWVDSAVKSILVGSHDGHVQRCVQLDDVPHLVPVVAVVEGWYVVLAGKAPQCHVPVEAEVLQVPTGIPPQQRVAPICACHQAKGPLHRPAQTDRHGMTSDPAAEQGGWCYSRGADLTESEKITSPRQSSLG